MSTLSFVLFLGPRKFKETKRTENSPYLFYLFYKSTMFCFYCECRCYGADEMRGVRIHLQGFY